MSGWSARALTSPVFPSRSLFPAYLCFSLLDIWIRIDAQTKGGFWFGSIDSSSYLIKHTQCCGSVIFSPGYEFFHPGSRVKKISDPGSGSASKKLSMLNPKKYFLSSRKCDPTCSSRIRILIFYPSRIQGSKGPGSGSATLSIS